MVDESGQSGDFLVKGSCRKNPLSSQISKKSQSRKGRSVALEISRRRSHT